MGKRTILLVIHFYIGMFCSFAQKDSCITLRGIVISQERVLPKFIPIDTTNVNDWKDVLQRNTVGVTLSYDPENELYNNSYVEIDSVAGNEFFRWVRIEFTLPYSVYMAMKNQNIVSENLSHSSGVYQIKTYLYLLEINFKTVKFLW